MSVNRVILLGNIGADPVIRTTQDGKKIATFSLATSEKWKDKQSGESKDKTEWHRVVVFSDGLSSVVQNYVKKGSKVYIEGALQTRKWSGNDGVEKYTTEIILQGFGCKLEIIDNRKDLESTNNSSSYDENEDIHGSTNIEDDIPF